METTSLPTSSTVPQYSWPIGVGSVTGLAPRYGHRSDPHTHVAEIRMMASVDLMIVGTSRSSKRTSRGAYRTAPRIAYLLSSLCTPPRRGERLLTAGSLSAYGGGRNSWPEATAFPETGFRQAVNRQSFGHKQLPEGECSQPADARRLGCEFLDGWRQMLPIESMDRRVQKSTRAQESGEAQRRAIPSARLVQGAEGSLGDHLFDLQRKAGNAAVTAMLL